MGRRVLRQRSPRRVMAFREDENDKGGMTPRVSKGGLASYDPDAVQVVGGLPAFTRRREIFVGRFAMIGFAAAWFGEVLTGQGILGQVQLWTGLSEEGALWLIGGIVALNLVGGLWPTGPTFAQENQEDVQKRPSGPVQEVMDPFTRPKQWLGISEWGFTKANELFHGRLAMLGFAGAVLVEWYQHQGVIAQVAQYLDKPVNYGVAGWGLAGWAVLATAVAYLFGNPGQLHGGKDIY